MTKHEYIKKICLIVAEKSSCEKSKVGAIFITSDYEILATGFNEAPSKFKHCQGIKKCLNKNGKCIMTAHAELNAIAQAAKNGIALKGAFIYCTRKPCAECMKLLINIGIVAIYCETKNEKQTIYDSAIKIEQW